VYSDLRDAGLPITDGKPADPDYQRLTEHNACRSSRSFVRTDSDTGWAVICVDPPRENYRRISDAFDDVPLLIGPLYVDDGAGETVIFGFGWPADASKQMYDAIGASGGNYLVEK
jgi:hypothetical protein